MQHDPLLRLGGEAALRAVLLQHVLLGAHPAAEFSPQLVRAHCLPPRAGVCLAWAGDVHSRCVQGADAAATAPAPALLSRCLQLPAPWAAVTLRHPGWRLPQVCLRMQAFPAWIMNLLSSWSSLLDVHLPSDITLTLTLPAFLPALQHQVGIQRCNQKHNIRFCHQFGANASIRPGQR